MLHYTLNTANTLDVSRKPFDPNAIALLMPLANRAKEEGQAQGPIPAPMDNYSVKITSQPGFALFDIYYGQEIVNTNAIAWTRCGQAEGWPLFEQFYLKLVGEMGSITISRGAPAMPDSLPWLATLILPSPWAMVPWLADFEQCLAKAIIQADRPPQRPPARGFGS